MNASPHLAKVILLLTQTASQMTLLCLSLPRGGKCRDSRFGLASGPARSPLLFSKKKKKKAHARGCLFEIHFLRDLLKRGWSISRAEQRSMGDLVLHL